MLPSSQRFLKFMAAIAAAVTLIGSSTTAAFSFVTTMTKTTTRSWGGPRLNPAYRRPPRGGVPNKATLQLQSTPSDLFDLAASSLFLSDATSAPPELAGISYSKASYYTVLGLYLLSFPGVWSQIKRSTEAKVKRKTFVSKGENSNDNGMSLRQQAGEIMACTCNIVKMIVPFGLVGSICFVPNGLTT
jgi:hypothetical protein